MSTVAEINTIFQTAISAVFYYSELLVAKYFLSNVRFLRLKMKVDVVDRTA